MKTTKAIFFNTLGIISGVIVGMLAYFLAYWIFFELIPMIPIIPSIISWPVDYEYYAITGAFGIDIFSGVGVCCFLCALGRTKYNYGVIILSVINLIRYINGFVQNIIHFGFSFSLLFVYGLSVGIIAIAFTEFFKNDNYEENLE